jgi:hypothetical protein
MKGTIGGNNVKFGLGVVVIGGNVVDGELHTDSH